MENNFLIWSQSLLVWKYIPWSEIPYVYVFFPILLNWEIYSNHEPFAPSTALFSYLYLREEGSQFLPWICLPQTSSHCSGFCHLWKNWHSNHKDTSETDFDWRKIVSPPSVCCFFNWKIIKWQKYEDKKAKSSTVMDSGWAGDLKGGPRLNT